MHIGLLCVQDLSNDRPCVSTMISMLGSENIDLPEPKQPAFTAKWAAEKRASFNDVSVTAVSGR